MMRRRAMLGALTAGSAVLLAGCVDELEDLLDTDVEAEAQPAVVAADVVDGSGYEHIETEVHVIDEDFDVASLYAENHVATYALTEIDPDDLEEGVDPDDIGVDASDASGLAVISTPSAEVAGEEVNPAGRLDNEELIEEFDDQFAGGGVSDLEFEERLDVDILGTAVEVDVFSGYLHHEDADDEAPAYLYIGSVGHEGDYIIPAAVHHADLDERDALVNLMEGIEHPV